MNHQAKNLAETKQLFSFFAKKAKQIELKNNTIPIL